MPRPEPLPTRWQLQCVCAVCTCRVGEIPNSLDAQGCAVVARLRGCGDHDSVSGSFWGSCHSGVVGFRYVVECCLWATCCVGGEFGTCGESELKDNKERGGVFLLKLWDSPLG